MTSRPKGVVHHWHQYLHPPSHKFPTLFRWSSRLLDTVNPPHTQCGFSSYILHLHALNPPGGLQLHLCVFSPAMSGYKNIPQKVVGLEEYLTGRVLVTSAVLLSCAGSLGASTAHGATATHVRAQWFKPQSAPIQCLALPGRDVGGAHLLNDHSTHALFENSLFLALCLPLAS